MAFISHLQDKSWSVKTTPKLSYRWIVREERNWQFFTERRSEFRSCDTHNSHIRTEQHSCRATDHLKECGKHLCDVQERYTVFVLETERDKHVRKAKEAYYIRLFQPMMNK
ncbi:hypothetical protein DPMN_042470 [Dreissena polymorpha]|uniref:Uncharacterized protein n=1 Tax=Dreissena polymorpha TaxID=45954 RepID=A0A9D4HWY0_DREPO|nr:hypothetical protein DPMN_042470 [Dreissena polymorpha]